MNPSLNITLQTVKKMKQGFSFINVYTLGISFGKANDIVSNRVQIGNSRLQLAYNLF